MTYRATLSYVLGSLTTLYGVVGAAPDHAVTVVAMGLALLAGPIVNGALDRPSPGLTRLAEQQDPALLGQLVGVKVQPPREAPAIEPARRPAESPYLIPGTECWQDNINKTVR